MTRNVARRSFIYLTLVDISFGMRLCLITYYNNQFAINLFETIKKITKYFYETEAFIKMNEIKRI
jgi:hypothetical protein